MPTVGAPGSGRDGGVPEISEEFLADPPTYGFVKGAVVGALVVVPAVGATVWALAGFGLGPPTLTFVEATRTTAIFCGLVAIVTAGGIGRLAAEASVLKRGGFLRAMWIGARTQAAAGAGLVVISSLPHGMIPASPWGWGALAAAGALGGLFAGAAIGLACGAPGPLGLVDVGALTRWPQEAIRKAANVVGWDDDLVPTPVPHPRSADLGAPRGVGADTLARDFAIAGRAATDGGPAGHRTQKAADVAAGVPAPGHDVIIEATVQRRPRIDDETPLPRPVPLAETAPHPAPALAESPRPVEPEERSDPTPLPAPVPLGETAPVRMPSEPGSRPGSEPREVREET